MTSEGTYLAAIPEGEVKGETTDALGLCAGRNLQTLNDTGEALVFQTGVLSFRVLTNDCKVDIFVTGGESRKRLAEDNGSIDVELLTHGNIPRDVARLRNRGEENPYAPDIIQIVS